MGTPSELTPETWLLKYMAAGIDCVAVTDHNSGEWIDKLKDAYARMKRDADAGLAPQGFRELYLFPGVEISVQGGFHLLAILDSSLGGQAISDLLARVAYDDTRGDSDGVTRDGAATVVEKVLAEGGIAIPAHADAAKGLLEVESGTLKTKRDVQTVRQVLMVPGLLAVEWLCPTNATPKIFDDLKLSLARIIGSDCHSFQGGAVPGSRYTWIKMAAPSLEGLRLALLDGQDVSVKRSDDGNGFSPFQRPEHFIEGIEVGDARFMGRGKPMQLHLNPYFNAFVGGRGTGKSTIVHALRLAFRRERELDASGEAAETFKRFNRISRNGADSGGLLDSTRISVLVSRDGVRHRLIWTQDGQGPVVEDWDAATGDWAPSASQAISEQRFPIRLFSQGQIAELSGDSQHALLRVIDDAAGSLDAQQLFTEAKQAFFATKAKLRELDGKLKGRDALNLDLQDVQRKLARFEDTHHAGVLKAYQRTSRQTRELNRQFDAVGEMVGQLQGMAQALLVEDLPDGLFDARVDADAIGVVAQIAQLVAQARSQMMAAARQLEDDSAALRGRLSRAPWQGRIEQSRLAYDELKADLATQGVSDPSEYGRLVQERQRLDAEMKRLDMLREQSDSLKKQADAQLTAVWLARREIGLVRARFLEHTLADNLFVRMTLIPYGADGQALERSLRDVLGTADKFKDDIYLESQDDGASQGLIADFLVTVELLDSFENAIRHLQERLVAACRGGGGFGARFNKFLAAEAEKRPELIDQILCWLPEDGVRVGYSRKSNGKDFQSIGQASAGQRAAAMLAFLLAHGDEPLVLDQPEDDLDNHLIYELVVQQIRSNKQRRQLIIVTHNPNIVVNGDAEMIHALDFNHQCFVKQSGSLQDKAMRDEVCKVMEGGKDAFERRYQRLGREG